MFGRCHRWPAHEARLIITESPRRSAKHLLSREPSLPNDPHARRKFATRAWPHVKPDAVQEPQTASGVVVRDHPTVTGSPMRIVPGAWIPAARIDFVATAESVKIRNMIDYLTSTVARYRVESAHTT
jgi:hypothetical protein